MRFINKKHSGFTLIELIVVIILTGILSTVMFQFITVPMESYVDVGRRTRLVDIADTAIQRIAYDVKAALPNSIRVGCQDTADLDGDGNTTEYLCFEFLHISTGGRYRLKPPGDALKFNPAVSDDSFDVLGPMDIPAEIKTGSSVNDCETNTASCVNVYNTGLSGSNAWNLDNLATLSDINTVPLNIGFINTGFSSGLPSFPASSPQQRFYLVDTPDKYICDPTSGVETLKRYQNYNIVSNEMNVDSHVELLALSNPAEHALLADQVTGCSFSYSAGTAERNAVLTISLTIGEYDHLSNVTENITLLQQVSVVNLP